MDPSKRELETTCKRRLVVKDKTPKLKGQCHEIFCFWFFSWISFPPAPEYSIRTVFNFFWKFAEILASQGAPPVSTTPVANFATIFASVVLPPVSTTTVANCHRYQWHWRQICHRYQRHRWQIIATTSGCRHLKVNLKAKIYIYVNSTTKRCPNKIIKIFLIEDFLHLQPVSTTPRWCTLSREYLRKFSKKFEMAERVHSGAGGKLIHEKNQKSKISWHCPFNLNHHCLALWWECNSV